MTTKAELLETFNALVLDDAALNDTRKYLLLDQAYRYYYSLVMEQDQGFYETYEDVALTSGTEAYELVNGWTKITNVEDVTHQDTNTNPTPIVYLSDTKVMKLLYERRGTPKRWWFEGNTLRFGPTSDSSRTARVYYIPKLVKLADMADTDTLVEPFDEWYMPIALRASGFFKARNAEEMQQLRQIESEERDRMIQETCQRQTQRPKTINFSRSLDVDEDN